MIEENAGMFCFTWIFHNHINMNVNEINFDKILIESDRICVLKICW